MSDAQDAAPEEFIAHSSRPRLGQAAFIRCASRPDGIISLADRETGQVLPGDLAGRNVPGTFRRTVPKPCAACCPLPSPGDTRGMSHLVSEEVHALRELLSRKSPKRQVLYSVRNSFPASMSKVRLREPIRGQVLCAMRNAARYCRAESCGG